MTKARDIPFPAEGGEFRVVGEALERVSPAAPAPAVIDIPTTEAPAWPDDDEPLTGGKGRKE